MPIVEELYKVLYEEKDIKLATLLILLVWIFKLEIIRFCVFIKVEVIFFFKEFILSIIWSTFLFLSST